MANSSCSIYAFTICAIRSGEVYSIQQYVIKIASDCGKSVVFSLDTPVFSTDKTDHQEITEISLKVALNTTHQPNHAKVISVSIVFLNK